MKQVSNDEGYHEMESSQNHTISIGWPTYVDLILDLGNKAKCDPPTPTPPIPLPPPKSLDPTTTTTILQLIKSAS